jgi:hypothetical protein
MSPADRPGTASDADVIVDLVDKLVPDDVSTAQRRLYASMLSCVQRMASERTDLIDLKLADAALGEMAEAFEVFRPFRHERKVTIFGSARTEPGHAAYHSARDLASSIADSDWMVVTGAGAGIMAAGMEGAGRKQSIGVNIRLPFEQGANAFIAQDPKLVEMRYFFTRKLMLIKESDGYVVLPGGFGTLDEAFELLTLLQTGKAMPAPVVLLDIPGGDYWSGWDRFVEEAVAPKGLISPEDRALFRITDSIEDAVGELQGFYRNYHSCRWVGDLLVLRVQVAPDQKALDDLTREFADILVSGVIRTTNPLPPERSDQDHLELPRLALRFDRTHYGRLRMLINRLNGLAGS